jgi:hypothetical protein
MAGQWKWNKDVLIPAFAFVFVAAVGVGGGSYIYSDLNSTGTDEGAETAPGEKPQKKSSGRKQDSSDVSIERDGVEYALWEGLVMEEQDNNELSGSFKTQYDQQIYNFDLGVVLHVSRGDGMISTPMTQLRAEHLERVRGIGCEIAAEFTKREAAGDGALPDDVAAFKARHCKPAGP